MDIECRSKESLPYMKDLPNGGVFKYGSVWYMKLTALSEQTVNCVRLVDGLLMYLDVEYKVQVPTKVTLVID